MDQQKALEANVRDYLPGIIHLSLATCAGNQPWVCEVHFAYDNDLNLYFLSTPTRRHSQEIAANPNVAGSIVTQHHKGQKPFGVYFEGTAKQLDAVDEHHPAFKLYDDRFSNGEWLGSELEKPNGHRLYQVTVSDFYIFDLRQNSNFKDKHHLPWANARSTGI